jgi:hypothetical protein
MRDTLITGALLAMPAAALLASVALALLVNKLRLRLQRVVNRRFHRPGMTPTSVGRPHAVRHDREVQRADAASLSSASAARLDVLANTKGSGRPACMSAS